MLNVPVTLAMAIPRADASRRILSGSSVGIRLGISGKLAHTMLICTQFRPQALAASRRASSVPAVNVVASRMPICGEAGPAAFALSGRQAVPATSVPAKQKRSRLLGTPP